MAELFGIDIASLVADALDQAGNLQPGTLIKQEDETEHSFQGFVELRTIRRADTLIVEPVPIMSIIGASISPAVVPDVNDRAEIADITYDLVRLRGRDPASAVYEFEVR